MLLFTIATMGRLDLSNPPYVSAEPPYCPSHSQRASLAYSRRRVLISCQSAVRGFAWRRPCWRRTGPRSDWCWERPSMRRAVKGFEIGRRSLAGLDYLFSICVVELDVSHQALYY